MPAASYTRTALVTFAASTYRRTTA